MDRKGDFDSRYSELNLKEYLKVHRIPKGIAKEVQLI